MEIEVSGPVAEFRVVLRVKSKSEKYSTSASSDLKAVDFPNEKTVFDAFMDNEDELRESISRVIQSNLGSDFDCQIMEIKKGSIEILYVIGATYAVYQGISKYKNFIESLKIVQQQVEDLLMRFAGNQSNDVKMVGSTMSPGPLLSQISSQPQSQIVPKEQSRLFTIFALYILISHGLFMGLLFYWILKNFL